MMTRESNSIGIQQNVDPTLQREKQVLEKAGSAGKSTAAAKKVSREFEALFVGLMLKSMRATVGKDELTGGGHGEEVYRSLLDQEYATAIAQQGSLGLGRLIEQQLESTNGNHTTKKDRTEP
jgi:flagellar protein FlgJ